MVFACMVEIQVSGAVFVCLEETRLLWAVERVRKARALYPSRPIDHVMTCRSVSPPIYFLHLIIGVPFKSVKVWHPFGLE